MKISMISEHASPLAALGGVDAGGQNVHVAALSQALADRGHTVTVFTRRDDPDLADVIDLGEGVTVVNVTAGPAAYVPKDELLPFMSELGQAVADYWAAHPASRPDIVHSHFWMSGLAARTALETVGLGDVPLAHTFHALGTVKRRHQGVHDTSPAERAELEPRVGHEATRIVATCSDEVAELEAMGITPEKASVVPCGVDLELFRADEDVEDTGGKRRIVCVGRLVARKGMDLAVRALARLVDRGYRDVELHIIGGGGVQADLNHDPEAVRLRQLAEELGIADKVVLRGQVPRENVPAILRSAALVACTPWYEPFGIVPLEAMACAVPVVAAQVGGLADTVVDGTTGLHVPPHDPEAIATAAALLLDDPRLAAALGRNGVERVRERYAWPVVAAATEEVYRTLLDQPVGVQRSDSNPQQPASEQQPGWEQLAVAAAADAAGTSADVLHLPVPPRAAELCPEKDAHPSTAKLNGTTAGLNGTTAGPNGATARSDGAPAMHDDGIEEHLDGVAAAVESLRQQAPTLRKWSRELASRLSNGQRLFTAGNGGSAAEAQHLSSELVGRFAEDRPAFSAIALSTDSSAVTAISNDYGYENVFARQLEAHARPGDLLILMTTSGKSPNLLKAVETARRMGVQTWALTGPGPNPLSEVCDDVVAVEAASPNVQEAHLMAIHSICRAFDAQIAQLSELRSERPAQDDRSSDSAAQPPTVDPAASDGRGIAASARNGRKVSRFREVRL